MSNEELIADARARAEHPETGSNTAQCLRECADALEAATVEPEWEYGIDTGLKWRGRSASGFGNTLSEAKENAEENFKAWSKFTNPRRRRKGIKPGPWEPVEGGTDV